MGLGKTLQSIAYITAVLQEKPEYNIEHTSGDKYRESGSLRGGETLATTDIDPETGLPLDKMASVNTDGLWSTMQQDGLTIRTRVIHPPVLVVAPASLTYNWANEFARFAPHLNVLIAAGQKEERANMLSGMDQAM